MTLIVRSRSPSAAADGGDVAEGRVGLVRAFVLQEGAGDVDVVGGLAPLLEGFELRHALPVDLREAEATTNEAKANRTQADIWQLVDGVGPAEASDHIDDRDADGEPDAE